MTLCSPSSLIHGQKKHAWAAATIWSALGWAMSSCKYLYIKLFQVFWDNQPHQSAGDAILWLSSLWVGLTTLHTTSFVCSSRWKLIMSESLVTASDCMKLWCLSKARHLRSKSMDCYTIFHQVVRLWSFLFLHTDTFIMSSMCPFLLTDCDHLDDLGLNIRKLGFSFTLQIKLHLLQKHFIFHQRVFQVGF